MGGGRGYFFDGLEYSEEEKEEEEKKGKKAKKKIEAIRLVYR